MSFFGLPRGFSQRSKQPNNDYIPHSSLSLSRLKPKKENKIIIIIAKLKLYYVCFSLLRVLGGMFRLELLRQRVKHPPERREIFQIRLLRFLFPHASSRVADARQLPRGNEFDRKVHAHGNARMPRLSVRVRKRNESGAHERALLFVYAFGHL